MKKREKDTGELLPAGESTIELDLDKVDTDLVDCAIREINDFVGERTLEFTLDLGEYLLDTFFSGKESNFRDRGRKPASFRALANREDDLAVSYSTLHSAVAVFVQYQLDLPACADELSVAHHRLLLPVKDNDLKKTLAIRAWKKKLSKRAFADEVRKVTEAHSERTKSGRPRLPPCIKAFRRIQKIVDLAREQDDDAFARLPVKETKELLGDVEKQLAELKEIAAEARARLSEFEGGAD